MCGITELADVSKEGHETQGRVGDTGHGDPRHGQEEEWGSRNTRYGNATRGQWLFVDTKFDQQTYLESKPRRCTPDTTRTGGTTTKAQP
jgi:hypothetical protein